MRGVDVPRWRTRLRSSRACRSRADAKSTIRATARLGVARPPSGERSIEELGRHSCRRETSRRSRAPSPHLRRAEQHRVDGIEIAAEALEDLGERRAVVARGGTRQLRGQLSPHRLAGPLTKSCTRPPKMIASLVRPMLVAWSGCGGLSGALPAASTIRSSGNFSACALCSATSTTRATICTEPARLLSGAKRMVSRSGGTPQSAATFSRLRQAAQRPIQCTSTARSETSWCCKLRKQRLAPGERPRRTRSRARRISPLRHVRSAQPAYWLARQAATGCELRTTTVHGQRGVASEGARRTAPRPPMHTAAIRSPASMPPGCSAPQSTMVSPRAPLRHADPELGLHPRPCGRRCAQRGR